MISIVCFLPTQKVRSTNQHEQEVIHPKILPRILGLAIQSRLIFDEKGDIQKDTDTDNETTESEAIST